MLTARPPRYLDWLETEAGLVDLVVCANGAMLYEPATRRTVHTRPLPLATAQRVAAAVLGAAPEVGFAVETGLRVVHDRSYGVRHVNDARLLVETADELWQHGDPIVKLLVASPLRPADELVLAAHSAAAGEAEYTQSGGLGLLEVSAAGVTKAGALVEFCAARGIAPEQVVAFGDMPNDLAMLSWAGAGYAMANAHPDVLATTRLRAPSNEDDGVARVLEQLLSAPG